MIALHAVLKFGLPGGGAVFGEGRLETSLRPLLILQEYFISLKPAQLIRWKVMEGILPHALQ